MVIFVVKYFVLSVISGVIGRVGELGWDIGKIFSMENLNKKDIERVEKELNKEVKVRKKKYYKMEVIREKLWFDMRGKYGIKKRWVYELVEIYIGILMLKSEKELLISFVDKD